jgi:hypothetical protein
MYLYDIYTRRFLTNYWSKHTKIKSSESMHTVPDCMEYQFLKCIKYDLLIFLSYFIFISVYTGHIGEDFAEDLQDGLLTSKVYFLIKSLMGYR